MYSVVVEYFDGSDVVDTWVCEKVDRFVSAGDWIRDFWWDGNSLACGDGEKVRISIRDESGKGKSRVWYDEVLESI